MRHQKSKAVPENLSELDLAKLAAFIDGEGHIGIGKCRTGRDRTGRVNYKMWVCIANTDPRLMTWLRRFVVGAFYVHRADGRGRRRPLYEWTVRSKEAADLLSRVLPHFVMKRDQAELAIEFSSAMRGAQKDAKGCFGRLPQEVLDARNAQMEKLKALREPRPLETVQ